MSSEKSGVSRRQLLGAVSAASAVASVGGVTRVLGAQPSRQATTAPSAMATMPELPHPIRDYWIDVAERLSEPVLSNLANRTLRRNMPIENDHGLAEFTHLEAFGRLLSGIAPWLEQDRPEKWLKLAQESMDAATDPDSPDFMVFDKPSQPLVDTAFLAAALIRAPETLWEQLDGRVKKNVIEAMKSTRVIEPAESNWLLFASMVEAAIHRFGDEPIVHERVDPALKKHMQWYVGDGTYGDGPEFHWDYYNSYVIQPFLMHTIETLEGEDPAWAAMREPVWKRARRYSEVQERMISPEGTYPVIGRSICYRFGAFQLLGQLALTHQLSADITLPGVRGAMTAVIHRQIEAPGTFDEDGWLTLGFCGHQPRIADGYISTGSLYLCANGLLPLGLPADDPFWAAPDEPWTNLKAWNGVNIPGDHALRS